MRGNTGQLRASKYGIKGQCKAKRAIEGNGNQDYGDKLCKNEYESAIQCS